MKINFLCLSLLSFMMLEKSLDSSQTWKTYQKPPHHFLSLSEVQEKEGHVRVGEATLSDKKAQGLE